MRYSTMTRRSQSGLIQIRIEIILAQKFGNEFFFLIGLLLLFLHEAAETKVSARLTLRARMLAVLIFWVISVRVEDGATDRVDQTGLLQIVGQSGGVEFGLAGQGQKIRVRLPPGHGGGFGRQVPDRRLGPTERGRGRRPQRPTGQIRRADLEGTGGRGAAGPMPPGRRRVHPGGGSRASGSSGGRPRRRGRRRRGQTRSALMLSHWRR